MIKKINIFLGVLLFLNSFLNGAYDTPNQFNTQAPLQQPLQLSANDSKIFGIVALMSYLNNFAKNPLINDKWEFIDIIKTVAFLAGAGCVVKLSLDFIPESIKRIPHILILLKNLFVKECNKLCGRPDPLRADQLMIWENVCENIAHTLCDQSVSGNVMLRNIRVQDDADEQGEDKNWRFFVSHVKEVFSYIIRYLNGSLDYYKHDDGTHALGITMLVKLADSFSTQHRSSITFIISMITTNLQHITTVCEQAPSADDLDTQHIKKLLRATLILFKELRRLIDHNNKPETRDAVSLTNSFRSDLSSNNSIIDF